MVRRGEVHYGKYGNLVATYNGVPLTADEYYEKMELPGLMFIPYTGKVITSPIRAITSFCPCCGELTQKFNGDEVYCGVCKKLFQTMMISKEKVIGTEKVMVEAEELVVVLEGAVAQKLCENSEW